jgi:peptidoglycan L-alanyl-D-glutamate endopeptidase CwlK
MEEIVVSGSLITDDPSTNAQIEGLHPSIRYDTAKFVNDVKDRTSLQLRIPNPSGYRTAQQQNDLLTSGQGVTPLPSGRSYHNYGLAFDVVGLNPDGRTTTYDIDFPGIGAVGKERGFEWGGDWRKQDKPHFQRNYGYTTDQLRQMMEPGARYPTIPGQRNR